MLTTDDSAAVHAQEEPNTLGQTQVVGPLGGLDQPNSTQAGMTTRFVLKIPVLVSDGVAPPPPTPTPVPVEPAQVEEVFPDRPTGVWTTFYYCLRTDYSHSDDGGTFCYATRSGVNVHPGTAACHEAWLGWQFKLVGDPYDRIYTCEDTGSAIEWGDVDIWFYTNGEGWNWPLGGQTNSVIWLN